MATKSIELSTKQKNQTLSAKTKKKSKKTFRYTLAQTFPRYWPQLNVEQSQEFLDLLKKIQSKNPQWFDKKKRTSSTRPIHYGLQNSIRKHKTGQIKLFVLSADLKPRYVANQIILHALAYNENIRILCVPSLETLTRTLLNFPCYAFVIDNMSECLELDKWTEKLISVHFPIPSILRKENKNRTKDIDEPDTNQRKITIPEETIDVKQFYLTRNNDSDNQRAFSPKNAINLKPIALELESLNKIQSNFISLDSYESNDQSTFSGSNSFKKTKKHQKTPLILYRELTINKIQSNPNKTKKIKKKKIKNKKKKMQ